MKWLLLVTFLSVGGQTEMLQVELKSKEACYAFADTIINAQDDSKYKTMLISSFNNATLPYCLNKATGKGCGLEGWWRDPNSTKGWKPLDANKCQE